MSVFAMACVACFWIAIPPAEAIGTSGNFGYRVEWMAEQADAIGIYKLIAADHSAKLTLDSCLKSSPSRSLLLPLHKIPTRHGPYLVFFIGFGSPPDRVIDQKVIDLSALSANGHFAASMSFEIYSSVDSLLLVVRDWAKEQNGECQGEEIFSLALGTGLRTGEKVSGNLCDSRVLSNSC